jgi:hypothetical protein
LTDLLQRLQGPQDATYYEARLNSLRNLPGITEPIEGAIARLRAGGPDSYRQGAASVRVAFEALVNELTSERDWKAGILRLVQSDEERGIARRLHRLLSRSAHPGHPTSKEDLQLVLDLFATVATRLVQLRASPRTNEHAYGTRPSLGNPDGWVGRSTEIGQRSCLGGVAGCGAREVSTYDATPGSVYRQELDRGLTS